jgi:hypothetical protein
MTPFKLHRNSPSIAGLVAAVLFFDRPRGWTNSPAHGSNAALWTGSWNYAEDTVPHQRVTAKRPGRARDSDTPQRDEPDAIMCTPRSVGAPGSNSWGDPVQLLRFQVFCGQSFPSWSEGHTFMLILSQAVQRERRGSVNGDGNLGARSTVTRAGSLSFLFPTPYRNVAKKTRGT